MHAAKAAFQLACFQEEGDGSLSFKGSYKQIQKLTSSELYD